MTRWLLAACFMIALPACAAQTTAMVECPASGCPSTTPIDPLSAELNRVASRELDCDASEIQFTATADADDSNGPWEARGCGRVTVYRNARGNIERTALIANIAQ